MDMRSGLFFRLAKNCDQGHCDVSLGRLIMFPWCWPHPTRWCPINNETPVMERERIALGRVIHRFSPCPGGVCQLPEAWGVWSVARARSGQRQATSEATRSNGTAISRTPRVVGSG